MADARAMTPAMPDLPRTRRAYDHRLRGSINVSSLVATWAPVMKAF
jgi:hypothetical protein